MDWHWTIDRWQITQAIQAGRVFRKADNIDWINRGGRMTNSFGTCRIGRLLNPFTDGGLVVLAADGIWVWTEAGAALYAAESARRGGKVTVR